MFNWVNHLRRTSAAKSKPTRVMVKSVDLSINPVVDQNIECMKYLIVGLGNPGSEYSNTRHNIGFDTVDVLASAEKLTWDDVKHGKTCSFRMKGKTVILLKPSTFMNLSGKALNYWMQQEKIPIQNVLVVVDDLALPIGTLRIKPKGSDAGHNGLKNIHEVLGHTEYARLRFGIGSDFPRGRQVDFVLGKWSETEKIELSLRLDVACEMVRSFVAIGLQGTMTAFNNK